MDCATFRRDIEDSLKLGPSVLVRKRREVHPTPSDRQRKMIQKEGQQPLSIGTSSIFNADA
jgi:hypothetical protein